MATEVRVQRAAAMAEAAVVEVLVGAARLAVAVGGDRRLWGHRWRMYPPRGPVMGDGYETAQSKGRDARVSLRDTAKRDVSRRRTRGPRGETDKCSGSDTASSLLSRAIAAWDM